MKEVVEEIDTVLGNEKITDISQVKKLVKLEACIKEALRLCKKKNNLYYSTNKNLIFSKRSSCRSSPV